MGCNVGRGIVEVILDATRNYDKLLTKDRLFGWYTACFLPVGNGMQRALL